MMRRFLITALLAGSLVSVYVAAGAQTSNTSDTYRQLNLFGDVFERVRADYVDEVGDDELIESAINGMLSSLDPHSSFLNLRNFKDMQVQTKGEFGGLGIEVTLESGFVKVVSPIDDTPAHRAGIQPGDLITHLDGDSVLGLTLREAVDRMRGKVDTDLKLTIRRTGTEPFDVTLTRAVIKIGSVNGRAEGNVAVVRIKTFNEQAEAGLKKEMKRLKEELAGRIVGVVLDLRNNPGGLLDQAVSISDDFLDKGEIVSTRGRESDDIQRYNAREGDLAEGLPMVVLINGGSASASEIVAGALQDHRRAVVLGTKSFGKGSVQTIIPLSGQVAMRLTTGRYYTPSGRSIQAKGIDPDIVVEQARLESLAPPRRSREADLPNSLVNPENDNVEGSDSTPPAPAPDAESPDTSDAPVVEPQDYQLARAVDLLEGLALFGQKTVN